MTKVFKLLAGGGLATVLGVLLLGISGAFSATDVEAQAPPSRPARFAGTVRVDGVAPPVGTTIEATINGVACSFQPGRTLDAAGNYVIDVDALDPGRVRNCGIDGSAVRFLVGGRLANETGIFHDYQLNTLNLTVTTPTPTPTATATATVTTTTTASPTGSATGSPTGAATTPAGGGGGGGGTGSTPRAPSTGSGTGDTAGMGWLFAVLGLGALAFGVGGLAVSRRSR